MIVLGKIAQHGASGGIAFSLPIKGSDKWKVSDVACGWLF